MIPVAIPAIWFYLLPLLSLLALVCLAVWGLGLALSAGWRGALRRHPWRALALALPLLALVAYGADFALSVWRYQQGAARQEAARRLVLDAPRTVAGIAMPAGTRLQLMRPGQPETFIEAEFDQPVLVQGLAARRLARRVSARYDAHSYQEIGSDVLSMSVFGEGAQRVQGWSCDAGEAIEFEFHDGVPVFEQCTLAAGDSHALAVPGARLRASKGTVYIDGHVDPDRWVIRLQAGQSLRLAGMWLAEANLRLDETGALFAVSAGTLICPFALGPLQYPVGTQVQTLARGWQGRRPWLFTLAAGAHAAYAGHADVQGGESVAQAREGEVLSVAPSRELGVREWMKLGPDAALPACPD
ncbi:hypothetical protein [Bordetella genomosp. 12]|uniref:Uncharacterized protein n=1 Tax=Bordetella genomosp. 12 TaxID=463035 RepID=A0A261VWL3_9BORD|nr:hypothetical protein [Bordetella genomosp. 12]OZI77882.1 hypothetical protein CAL22_04970 [Bordetella genomosp. 12]